MLRTLPELYVIVCVNLLDEIENNVLNLAILVPMRSDTEV